MSVTLSDLKLYYADRDPDDDLVNPIGGPISHSKRPSFSDAAGLMKIVSSHIADSTQSVLVFGRDGSGAIVSETAALNGQTPVALATTFERLLKAIKTGICSGDVAVEAQTGILTGVLAGTTLYDVTLPVGFSAVDNFYNQWVLRSTGTGKAIRRVINYVGASRLATVDHPYTKLFPTTGADMSGTSEAFQLTKGYFFEKLPFEVIEVRRPFYNAAADVPGGATKKYYSKMFWENSNPTGNALLNAQVVEAGDPNADVAFALATAFTDSLYNAGTRLVAPVTGVTAFDSTTKNVPGGGQDIRSGSSIAMWAELTLVAGQAAQNSTWLPRLTGTTT